MQASVVIATSLAVGTAVKGSYLFGAGIEACRVGIWTTEDALPETVHARANLQPDFHYMQPFRTESASRVSSRVKKNEVRLEKRRVL